MVRYLWLSAPLAASALLLPASFQLLLLIGFALLALIHRLSGIALHPLWFRCVIWIVSAAVLTALPISGLGIFPLGALATELRYLRRDRTRRTASVPDEDGRPAPAWVAS
jgi:hypothetical protein